ESSGGVLFTDDGAKNAHAAAIGSIRVGVSVTLRITIHVPLQRAAQVVTCQIPSRAISHFALVEGIPADTEVERIRSRCRPRTEQQLGATVGDGVTVQQAVGEVNTASEVAGRAANGERTRSNSCKRTICCQQRYSQRQKRFFHYHSSKDMPVKKAH